MAAMARGALLFVAGVLVGANALYFAIARGWFPVPSDAGRPDFAGIPGTATPVPAEDASGTPQPEARTPPAAADSPSPGSREWWATRSRARAGSDTLPTPTGPVAPPSQGGQPTPPPPAALPQVTTPSPDAGSLPRGRLLIPVAGIRAADLRDTFKDARSEGRAHDAIDIMAPLGTAVYAADDGRIAKLFDSRLGGITIYQFDPSESYVYYYAHLHGYAPGLAEGQAVRRGQVIGYVGYTGNASPDGPHLHFAVSILDAEKKWWKATPVNPFPLLTDGQLARAGDGAG